MTVKDTKIGAKPLDMLYLIDENEVKEEMGEAFASAMLNPTVTWAKFVLTDDQTNANGERVPHEEFPNLIKSGIHMPVKMVFGEIQGHPNSRPLGTITHLKEVQNEDGSFAIVALAALWSKERPADIEYIKQRFAEKKSVDTSWEILYEDSTLNNEKNSVDLHGTVLSATTIVGNPAYQGRTPFLAISSKKEAEITNEEITEDISMEVKDLEAKLAELEPQLATALSEIERLKNEKAEKETEIATLTEQNTAKETELATLRDFKASVEAEAARIEKLETIKTKFNEAGLNRDDKYFTDNEAKLLKMDDEGLEFFIQEMAANLSEEDKNESSASTKSKKIPALKGTEDGDDLSVAGLAKYLREKNQGK